jgi:hypothetical protein
MEKVVIQVKNGISIKDFKQLRSIAGKYNTEIKRSKRHGAHHLTAEVATRHERHWLRNELSRAPGVVDARNEQRRERHLDVRSEQPQQRHLSYAAA